MAGLRLACKLGGGYPLISDAGHDVAPSGFNRCDRRRGQRRLPTTGNRRPQGEVGFFYFDLEVNPAIAVPVPVRVPACAGGN